MSATACRPDGVLAELDTSGLQASLAGAQADVAFRASCFVHPAGRRRPEELAEYQQKYVDASAALIIAMKNAYLQTDDAVTNKADTAYNNGSSANPAIAIQTQSQIQQSSINQQRVSAGNALNSWKSALATLDPAATSTAILDQARTATQSAIATIKNFLDDLGTIANNLTPSNSGLSQSAIDLYTSAVSTAGQEAVAAATAEQAADTAWSSTQSSLALEQAGSTAQDIAAGEAAVPMSAGRSRRRSGASWRMRSSPPRSPAS